MWKIQSNKTVWLVCSFTTVFSGIFMGTSAAPHNHCYRKSCNGTYYDIREAVCCENHHHLGAGLSCCGDKAFNPAAATCCEVGHGNTREAHVTEGLSEHVSACCGLTAYNPLNEMCCQSTVVIKSAAKARCCGKGTFDDHTQLCCSMMHDNIILMRESSDHECCGRGQFNTKTECCNDDLEVHPKQFSHCGNEYGSSDDKNLLCGPDGNRTTLKRESSDHECCGHRQFNTKTECCSYDLEIHPKQSSHCEKESGSSDDKNLLCGPDGNRTTLKRESSDHECCGHRQFNTKTECCSYDLEIHPKQSSHCEKESGSSDDKNLLCGPDGNRTTLKRESSDHECCGHRQFNTKTECCSYDLEIHPKQSSHCEKESGSSDDKNLLCGPDGNRTTLKRESSDHECCGHHQFNTKTECCSYDLEIHPKQSSHCEKESGSSDDKNLLCGPDGNKTTLKRESSDHECCGHRQFNTKTERCSDDLEIHPKQSSHCEKESVMQQQPNCTGTHTGLRGKSHQCCSSAAKQIPTLRPVDFGAQALTCIYQRAYCPEPAAGQCKDTLTVHNPRTHVCCNGCLSERIPLLDLTDSSPGQHCCGTEVYQPHEEICCDGRRYPKAHNVHCCGGQAYDIKNQQMKCCAGTLYNLTLHGIHGHKALCCGSVLQKPQDVCCSHEDKHVLWSAKPGHRCCGHLYYNMSLWSCCAGELSPGHHQDTRNKESGLQSLNNLNETDLCKKMLMGTVESVSQRSIVLSNALKIEGRCRSLEALPSPHIRQTPDHCNFPKLIPGKTYFFDVHNEHKVFTDSNHETALQSLHFIFYACGHH